MTSSYHSIMMPIQVYQKCPDMLKKARVSLIQTTHCLHLVPQSPKYYLLYFFYFTLMRQTNLRKNLKFYQRLKKGKTK